MGGSMHWRNVSLALAAAVLWAGTAAADAEKKATKAEASFGALKAPEGAEAKKLAEAWLKAVGKTDAASQAKFTKIWQSEGTTLDKVTATLVFGDAEAAKLLRNANDEEAAAPTELPALLKDAKKPAFYRANLALAYG